MGQADLDTLALLMLNFACATSDVPLYDKVGVAGVLLKHVHTAVKPFVTTLEYKLCLKYCRKTIFFEPVFWSHLQWDLLR